MTNAFEIIEPGQFEPANHFYDKALNAQMHSMVSYFLSLSQQQMVERYIHMNPKVSYDKLESILKQPTRHFFWGGADLFYVTTAAGNRKMIVLETNSCPSGQKSMPSMNDSDEYRGYKQLIENSFLPQLKKRRLPSGVLAVIYDKNKMEASGYAATLADLTQEAVYLVPYMNDAPEPCHFKDGVLTLNHKTTPIPVRACFRYVTQQPWNRIPVSTKTFIYNSTLVCLSGGRNKLIANKAYEFYNSEIAETGLAINTPKTIRDVSKLEVPLWVERFGGYAVVKVPYGNAGQGVFTITSENELKDFMEKEHHYDQFIVQSLIGHYNWSSSSHTGKYYHIGTLPNKKNDIFVADLRVMVYSTPNGFLPCALYARKARKPLAANIESAESSWDILGTNLSIKKGKNNWDSDTARLMLMDRRDFNTTGIGIDDLIEAYIQTVLSITAIDHMAQNFLNSKNQFRKKLFSSMDSDQKLINEIKVSS